MSRHPTPERLSAFLAGNLTARDADVVRAHVAGDGGPGCAACAAAVADLAALARAARALDRPEPPPTLWSAIAGRLEALEAPERRFWSWRASLIGALAGGTAVAVTIWALVALGAFGARRGTGGQAVVTPTPTPTPTAGQPVTPAVDPLLAEAEAELNRAAGSYEQATLRLRGLLAREQKHWDPEAQARVSVRLARLDQAVAEERAALRLHTADGAESLFAAYRRQIDFLAEAVHRGTPAAPEWR